MCTERGRFSMQLHLAPISSEASRISQSLFSSEPLKTRKRLNALVNALCRFIRSLNKMAGDTYEEVFFFKNNINVHLVSGDEVG